ncbi:DHA2 family efflux MFS transporter permease subunit [Gorillibacterium timonense]|uniref:DHA2 family efflux MFS transporter permease subunit n=1 Tax=Gorillibacterium timonense TaxID=1689269 RepID=UPI00071D3E2D|nr:DHA2 family efflux MFS transporter permease subunit [Gorillibacterium timonense]
MKHLSHKWSVLLAVLLGTFTVILNTSLLNPAIPFFVRQFQIDEFQASWIINIYILVVGITLPLTGFLSERYGAKKIYIAGLFLFLIGSIAASAAGNLPVLIISRGLQGLGAGLLTPLSITLIFAAVPIQERGVATGIWGVVSMVAPTVGPTLGGVIVDFGSPRLLFLANLPTGVLGLIAAIGLIQPSATGKPGPFDKKGYLTVFLGVGLTLYALGKMGTFEQALSPLNWLLLAGGLVSLVLFVIHQQAIQHPLLHLSLLKIRPFRTGTIVTTLGAVGYYMSFFLIPLVLQDVYHYSATVTGLMFIPDALMTGIFMIVGGKILDRNGAKNVVAAGLFIVGITTLLLGWLSAESPLWYIALLLAVRGAGFGLSCIPATTAGMGTLPEHRLVEGSVLNDLVEQLVSSFAIVIALLAFVLRRGHSVARHVPLEVANLQVANSLFLVLGGLTFVVLVIWWREFQSGTVRGGSEE